MATLIAASSLMGVLSRLLPGRPAGRNAAENHPGSKMSMTHGWRNTIEQIRSKPVASPSRNKRLGRLYQRNAAVPITLSTGRDERYHYFRDFFLRQRHDPSCWVAAFEVSLQRARPWLNW
jgi:hypothetical protein